MAVFVTLHLSNHALGIISTEAMESMRGLHTLVWGNLVGGTVLYSTLCVHFLLGLRALYRRSTLKMPLWEAAQIAFGFSIPLLLIGHITGVQIAPWMLGFDIDYPYVLGSLWSDSWLRIKQPLLVVIVWVHVTIGLHIWLRLKPWYRQWVPVFFAVAILLPALAILGFVRAGLDMQVLLANPEVYAEVFEGRLQVPVERRERVGAIGDYAFWVLLFMILATIIARWFRYWLANRQPKYVIHHPISGKVKGLVGQSVLEALRAARVPHASICGGRARCTTCRINIDRGGEWLDQPNNLEAAALKRIDAQDRIRLACQIRPVREIWITPLLPPEIGPRDLQRGAGISGREQEVVALFVDLRGSTSLAEARLPYDVVLILNQFFAQMSAALDATGGHYAQFSGDGLLALYGMRGDLKQACRNALTGAVEMQRRLDSLNERFMGELDTPLRIGIGIHCGEAIVGTMGPPSARILSAVGDSVNIAARLEAATKLFGCIAVISQSTIERAEIELKSVTMENIEIRGRRKAMSVYQVFNIHDLGSTKTIMR